MSLAVAIASLVMAAAAVVGVILQGVALAKARARLSMFERMHGLSPRTIEEAAHHTVDHP